MPIPAIHKKYDFQHPARIPESRYFGPRGGIFRRIGVCGVDKNDYFCSMDRYKDTDQMVDLIADDYRMLQVMSRFGITFGFGDNSVASACRASGVDTGTFLCVVNYIKDAAHAHINEMVERVSLPALMQYLRQSHTYFVDFRLPSIRRKLIQAIDCSGANQVAFLILRFYDEYAQEVAAHMDYENQHVHPYVQTLLAGRMPEGDFAAVCGQQGSHSNIEKSIQELKTVILKYSPTESSAQLLNEVLMDIYITEEDLLSHCHLEDTLFAQCVQRLEADLRERGVTPADGDPDAEPTPSDGLSERERDVVRHVVQGLSNKEIADRMYISVNTVMTHRRNISRKLQIHSAAGLTIYALVNGLIRLEDVKGA